MGWGRRGWSLCRWGLGVGLDEVGLKEVESRGGV